MIWNIPDVGVKEFAESLAADNAMFVRLIHNSAFFLAKQKKVTCCRATPDGFDFELLGIATLNPTLYYPRTTN